MLGIEESVAQSSCAGVCEFGNLGLWVREQTRTVPVTGR